MIRPMFIPVAQTIIAVSSLLALASCCVLLGLSAWMIAYRFRWTTWYGVAQIDSEPSGLSFDGKLIRYIPLDMWMSPYYLVLATACTGVFLCFTMAFVNIRKDLHSRIIVSSQPVITVN